MSRRRTLSARMAVNVNDFGAGNGGPGSFEALCRRLLPDECPRADRMIDLGDIVVEIANFCHKESHSLLHIVGYTPREGIQVVPTGPQADLRIEPPPHDAEYLDGEAMLLVRGNEVILCRSGFPEGVLTRFFEALATGQNIAPDHSRMALMKRVHIDRLAEVAQRGVKAITMNAVAGSIAVDEAARASVKSKLFGRLVDEIQDILGIEGPVPEEAENLKVGVSISLDRRKGTELEAQQLREIAEMLIEGDEDGFRIVTSDNQKFGADDVSISLLVEMREYGKSVSWRDAWEHMEAFDQSLRRRADG